MKVTVEVTQNDIDTGIKENCFNCPVAIAILDATKKYGYSMASVQLINIKIYEDIYTWIELPTPKTVQKFLPAFDNGEAVEPFSFEIKLPNQKVANNG